MSAADESTTVSVDTGGKVKDSFQSQDITLPNAFGNYVLIKELSRNAARGVFLATAHELGGYKRVCVVKTAGSVLSQQKGFEKLFAKAGRRLVHLDHRNIAQVFDTGQVDNIFFLAQEHVPGVSLGELLGAVADHGERLPLDIAILIIVDFLRGLYHSMRQFGPEGKPLNIWHGRLKPRHVMLSNRGEVKLIGFDREWNILPTANGASEYEAPEITNGETGGPKSDVFSSAKIVNTVFDEKYIEASDLETLNKIRPDLNTLLQTCMSESQDDRPKDVGALLRPLRAALHKLNPKCGPPELEDYLWSRVGDSLKRRSVLAKSAFKAKSPAERTVETKRPLTRTLLLETDKPIQARAVDRAVSEMDPIMGPLKGTRYKILRPIGEGGMGMVYAAEHVDLEKVFALKILREKKKTQRTSVVEGLRREARATSKLGHPNIVSVTDFGETPDGRVFFVMEYLEGISLGELLEEHEKLEPEVVVNILVQVCDGLAAAHAKGVIHRDIKPDNIFLTKDSEDRQLVKILDFGVAVPAGSQKDKAAHIAGTPYYMSPEMIRMKPLDGRSDLYSVGVLAYEALCGKRPFGKGPVLKLLRAHLKDEPPKLRTQPDSDDIHPALEAIVMRTLRKSPVDRFPDARTMALELRAYLDRRRAEQEQQWASKNFGFESEKVQQEIDDTWAEALAQLDQPEEIEEQPNKIFKLALALGVSTALITLAIAGIWLSISWNSADSQQNGNQQQEVHVSSIDAPPKLAPDSGFKALPTNSNPGSADSGQVETGSVDANGETVGKNDGSLHDSSLDDVDPDSFVMVFDDVEEDTGTQKRSKNKRRKRKVRNPRKSKVAQHIEDADEAFSQGRMGQAESEYRQALSIDSRRHDALAGLGRVAFQRGNYSKAESYARRALERRPRSARYRLQLGAALFRQGRVADARVLFRQVLSDYPNNRAAKRYLEATERRR